ncbi:hypothetical protein BDW74DRAFT_180778 [Aspergillus multicolor]|uniref:uncharacterized protein n=1 Tax=Aspergillus multicolor TaxID=41759 RepID=UPI003CCDCB0F
MAAPDAAAEAIAIANSEVIDPDLNISIPLDTYTSPPSLIKRANTVGKIVNSAPGSVKGRSGPGFSYGVTAYVIPGKNYQFSCYQRGDCYSGNWYVHATINPG